ncbi:hypothetical protein THRCLA_08794 [Thraustotheca clavata]|uniref:Uncharacterized protein n=1 Tax=Thraustotheca clavata TaxID=74557 RepID=A0A1V9Z2G9_9STRA|nr:hypothetical protein THRCLA_08794 [Thraustotheca clavata]
MATAFGKCADEMKVPTKVLSILSLVLSAGVFMYKTKQTQGRHFPANMAMLTCCYSALFSAVIILDSIRDESTPTTHGSMATCRILGMAYQLLASLVIWNWILTVVILYMVLGRRLPYSVVGSYDTMYYCLLTCVPSILLSIGLSRNSFGWNEDTKICWFVHPSHEFMLFHSQLLFGLVVFIAMVPSLIKGLPFYAELHAPFYYCVCMAVASALMLLFGINLFIYEANEDNAYVQSTMESYCALHSVDLSLLGTMAALFHLWPSYADLAPQEQKQWTQPGAPAPRASDDSSVRRPLPSQTPSSHHSHNPSESHTSHVSSQPSSTQPSSSAKSSRPGSHAILRSYVMPQQQRTPLASASSQPSPAPRTSTNITVVDTLPHLHPDLCQSAFDSACGTAVSVPPDFQVRLAQQQATVAYTNLMLGYVRDQLIAEGYDMSSREMSTFLSTLTKSVLASSRSMASNNPNTLDVRLVQAMERYRREQQATDLSASSSSQYNTNSSKKSISLKDLDLDARLAMARERYEREQTFIMGNATELSTSSADSDDDSSFHGDLDARLAAARQLWLSDMNDRVGDEEKSQEKANYSVI